MSDHNATVRENPAEQQFEIWLGGRRAGVTVYEPEGDTYAFVHTEVDPSFSGQGLASRLVGSALDTMRERHLAVLPLCPFVVKYIQDHPAYADLVPADQRPRFDLPSEATTP